MNFRGRDITIVAGIHGFEKAPVRALHDNDIDFIVGNPRALEEHERFIEQDLNSSFGTFNETYESQRAREILQKIPEDNVVIDFHTTTAVSPPFAILVDEKMLPFARRMGVKYAALMTFNMKKGNALINHRDGISIEMTGYDTQESYDKTLEILKYFTSEEETDMEVFEVYGTITKQGDYENFKEHPDGFYPVLFGAEVYDFLGLKARKLT